jgi:flagellar hook-length control protein FliK
VQNAPAQKQDSIAMNDNGDASSLAMMTGTAAGTGTLPGDALTPPVQDHAHAATAAPPVADTMDGRQDYASVKQADASDQQKHPANGKLAAGFERVPAPPQQSGDPRHAILTEQSSAEAGQRQDRTMPTAAPVGQNADAAAGLADIQALQQRSAHQEGITEAEIGVMPFAEESLDPDQSASGTKKRPVSMELSCSSGEDHAQVFTAQHHQSPANASGMLSGERQVPRLPVTGSPDGLETAVPIVRNGNQVAVTVEPDGLGTVRINLSLDRGLVHGQFHVTDDAARTLIDNNIQNLVETLARDGLGVGGFSVSLRGSGHHAAGDGPFTSPPPPAPATEGTSEADRRSKVGTDRLISIFV